VPTKVQICNLALVRVGQRDAISSLADGSTAADICNAVFDQLRDTLLTSFPWPFAAKHAELAVLSSAERTGWGLVYALPTDCLQARYIYAGKRNPTADQRIPFTVELNDAGSGRVLCTDLEDAELIYTAKVTVETAWPPLFCEALAWAVARELAMGLAVKPELQVRAAQMAEMSLHRATAVSQDEKQERRPKSRFISGR
jgi:hypothetical protein